MTPVLKDGRSHDQARSLCKCLICTHLLEYNFRTRPDKCDREALHLFFHSQPRPLKYSWRTCSQSRGTAVFYSVLDSAILGLLELIPGVPLRVPRKQVFSVSDLVSEVYSRVSTLYVRSSRPRCSSSAIPVRHHAYN